MEAFCKVIQQGNYENRPVCLRHSVIGWFECFSGLSREASCNCRLKAPIGAVYFCFWPQKLSKYSNKAACRTDGTILKMTLRDIMAFAIIDFISTPPLAPKISPIYLSWCLFWQLVLANSSGWHMFCHSVNMRCKCMTTSQTFKEWCWLVRYAQLFLK